MFGKRLNGKGCVAAMIVGFIMGIFRMAVDTPVTLGWFGYDAKGMANGYAEGSFLWIVNNTYFQYFSLLIAFVSAVTMIAVSYLTEAAAVRQDQGTHLGNGHGGRPPRDPRELGLARRAGLGLYLAVHPWRLPVLPRIKAMIDLDHLQFPVVVVRKHGRTSQP